MIVVVWVLLSSHDRKSTFFLLQKIRGIYLGAGGIAAPSLEVGKGNGCENNNQDGIRGGIGGGWSNRKILLLVDDIAQAT